MFAVSLEKIKRFSLLLPGASLSFQALTAVTGGNALTSAALLFFFFFFKFQMVFMMDECDQNTLHKCLKFAKNI